MVTQPEVQHLRSDLDGAGDFRARCTPHTQNPYLRVHTLRDGALCDVGTNTRTSRPLGASGAYGDRWARVPFAY